MKQRPPLKELWDLKAEEWHAKVGDDGDGNRRFNTDPVLWRLLGEVEGLMVLDAGCGTGYLCRKLARKGARVVGIDFSERMIETATHLGAAQELAIDLRVDCCSTLATLGSESVDKIVSNFVLMDCDDLDGCAAAFHRVLKPGGIAVLILTHPCFPQSDMTGLPDDGSVTYRWAMSYFAEHEVLETWRGFSSPAVYHHRSLTMYWKAFREAGFEVLDLEEPVVGDPPPQGSAEAGTRRSRMRPNSLAFLLHKPE